MKVVVKLIQRYGSAIHKDKVVIYPTGLPIPRIDEWIDFKGLVVGKVYSVYHNTIGDVTEIELNIWSK